MGLKNRSVYLVECLLAPSVTKSVDKSYTIYAILRLEQPGLLLNGNICIDCERRHAGGRECLCENKEVIESQELYVLIAEAQQSGGNYLRRFRKRYTNVLLD